MKHAFLVLAVVLAMTACSRPAEKESYADASAPAQSFAAQPPPPDPCALQHADYQRAMATWRTEQDVWRQADSDRLNRCRQNEDEQVRLNIDYDNFRSRYPVTSSALESCAGEPTNRAKEDCVMSYCLTAALFGVNCNVMGRDLNGISQRQEVVDRRSTQDCCTMPASRFNSAVRNPARASCTPPVAPPQPVAPTCTPRQAY